jgi:K+-sensing histidine kinase KdpD
VSNLGAVARREFVPALRTVVVAGAIVAIAVGVKLAVSLATMGNAGFVIYVPAVAIAAWYRGFLGGVLATVLAALLDTLLFRPPLEVLATELADYQIRLVAYITGGVAVSYLAYRLRRERDLARRESAERRRALEEVAAAQAELARLVATERRASELRDAFNGIISHELRTPITAIYGGAKLLARRDRALEPDTRQELIDDLEAEADRLYRLVEDLLVLSRTERGSIERADDPVVVQRVVDRVVNSERSRWPAISFEVETSATSTARGDETYVEQVMRNLLSNAAKYSPAGTTVTAVVDESPEGVRVRVLDRGAGIQPDESARLFELYYRSPATAVAISGAGIGLFVCRALVEAMGGRIWATPRVGGGSEFGFVLARQLEDEPLSDS